MEPHDPVNQVRKLGPGELHHVDLDSYGAHDVDERFDEALRIVRIVKSRVDQVGAAKSRGPAAVSRPLCPTTARAARSHWRLRRVRLESDAHLTLGVIVSVVALGRHRVGKNEKQGAFARGSRETLQEQLIFVVEHEREAFARDIAGRLALNGVAKRHVVGGNCLCNRGGCAAGPLPRVTSAGIGSHVN